MTRSSPPTVIEHPLVDAIAVRVGGTDPYIACVVEGSATAAVRVPWDNGSSRPLRPP